MATWKPHVKRSSKVTLREIKNTTGEDIVAEGSKPLKEISLKRIASDQNWSGQTKNTTSWTAQSKN